MKTIIQSEAAECGLACLAMVAGFHGAHLGMPEMRRRFPLALKGVKLSRLIHVGQELGFQARALRLDLEDLPQLAAPCILHWDLNHFVVLVRAGKKKVRIIDPALGRRDLTYREASDHFTGVALELSPSATFKPNKPSPSISARQLTGRVAGLWRSLALILALSIALQVFAVLGPFFMQWVVDQVL